MRSRRRAAGSRNTSKKKKAKRGLAAQVRDRFIPGRSSDKLIGDHRYIVVPIGFKHHQKF